MNCVNLEKRKANYKPSKIDILQSREDFKLMIRKEKLEDHFIKRRKSFFPESDLKFEIKSELLDVPESLKDSLSIIESLNDHKIKILNCFRSQNLDVIKYAINNLRKKLSVEEKYDSCLIDEDIIYALQGFLKTSVDSSIIYESLWCLINITYSESVSYSKIISSLETIEVLEKYLDIYLITSKEIEITNSVIWLIGHIIFDSIEVAEYIVNTHKIMRKLHEIITLHTNVSNTLMKNACWFIFDPFIKNKKIKEFPDDFAEMISNMLLIFSMQKDRQLRIDSIFALDQLLQKKGSNKIREKIIEEGLVDSLLSSQYDQDRDLLVPSIKLIGQMLAGDDNIVDSLVEKHVTTFLKKYLSDKNSKIRKDTCWAISNITCSKFHLKTLLNLSVFEELIYLVKNDVDNIVKKEALWALVNTCIYADFPLISYLNKQGIIKVFQKNLEKIVNDREIIQVTIEALNKIFEIGKVISNNDENPFVKEFLKFGGQETLDFVLNKYGRNDELYSTILIFSSKYLKINQ